MKKIKIGLLFVAFSAAIVSCKKETVELPTQERSLVKVTHHYLYGDEEYTVEYGFNSADQLITSKGDIKERTNLFSENKSTSKSVMLVENVNKAGTDFTIRFFDSAKEMNAYQGVKVPTQQDNSTVLKTPCYNNGWSGNASFRFYKHTNYNGEMTNIRRLNHAFFQIHYLNYHENDQISSLKVSNGSVDLFKDGCFYGTQIRFLHDIPNLHYFSASQVTVHNPNDPVDYIGARPTGFFPANYNFGDVTSSIKGWSI